MTASKVFKFIGLTILRIGLIILFLFITMYLWNSLIPILFHGPVISFWQTAGLIILSKIIFSGMVPVGRPRHNPNGWHGKFHKHEQEEWLKLFKEKKDKENSTQEV